MRYKYQHKKTFRSFIYLLIALFTILIVYTAMKWFGILLGDVQLYSKNLVFEVTIVVVSAFFILILINVLFLSYSIKEGRITLRLLFWDTFQKQLIISSIYKLVWSKRDDKLVLCYTDAKMQQRIAFVNIDQKQYDDFAVQIKKINPKILYEIAE